MAFEIGKYVFSPTKYKVSSLSYRKNLESNLVNIKNSVISTVSALAGRLTVILKFLASSVGDSV